MLPFETNPLAKFKSKGALIAEHIMAQIRAGQYPAGSKLPPERQISEQLGVSRPSVREAFSALQIVGIIESRPGDGTYVSMDMETDSLSARVKNMLEESDSPYEILQARRIIETGAIRLALQEANDEDIEQIKAVWKKKLDCGRSGDYQGYVALGKDFHLAIARATKNRIIISIMERLLSIHAQPLWQNMRKLDFDKNQPHIEQMIDVHNRLVKAVEERNLKEAILALEDDFDNAINQTYSL